MQPVYITGIGILSRIGLDYQDHLQFCIKSREEPFNANWNDDEKTIGKYGIIDNFEPKHYIYNKKSIKFMSRQCMLGCSASALAAEDAGITQKDSKDHSYETALVFGASVCDSVLPLLEAIKVSLKPDGSIDYSKLANEGIMNLPPLWILTSLPNTTAGQIAIQHNIKGTNFSLVNGPTGGLSAIGEAFRMIRENRAQRAFCGGSEGGVYPDFVNRLAAEGIVDKTADFPNCYGVATRGTILGEGAAVVTLEAREILVKRDREPYAEILGYCNGYIPNFKDMKTDEISSFYTTCMKKALDDADVQINNVSLVQGSGFGYEKVDKAEAMAVRGLIDSQTPITASNGIYGFTLGASGAVSLVTAIIQMQSQYLLPIISDKGLHFETEINYVTGSTPRKSMDIILVNCFDYLGCMSSLVIKKLGF